MRQTNWRGPLSDSRRSDWRTRAPIASFSTSQPALPGCLRCANTLFPPDLIELYAAVHAHAGLISSSEAVAKIHASRQEFRGKNYRYHRAADYQYDTILRTLRCKPRAVRSQAWRSGMGRCPEARYGTMTQTFD